MFNRRAYHDEISSLSSDDFLGDGGCFGGCFPEMAHDDLRSDGTQSPPGCRDEADCTIEDDYSHALFAQEQMFINCFENGKHSTRLMIFC